MRERWCVTGGWHTDDSDHAWMASPLPYGWRSRRALLFETWREAYDYAAAMARA